MARWGEGDPRWIVEERSDATNVNNWHWVEKNATPWSQERLNNLLLKQTIKGEEASAFNIVFTEFKKLEGEASANNRKAKLIFFFEWNIVIEFKATVAGSNVEYKGTVEVLNLSDENEANEIEISAQVDNPGPEANKIREILNKQGLQLVRTQLGKYIHELKKEFSQGLILPTDKSGAIGPQATVGKGKTVLVDKRGFQNDVIMSENNKKAADGTTAKTNTGKPEVGTTGGFELSETFKVPPERLYEILTEPELVAAWSPNSNVDPREGGTFSLLGGIIGGAFTKLVKDNQIAMKWRLKSYPPGHHADVQLMLCDQGDCVDLKLKADCVPEKAMEETKTGFSKYYFLAIGRKFGISLNMF